LLQLLEHILVWLWYRLLLFDNSHSTVKFLIWYIISCRGHELWLRQRVLRLIDEWLESTCHGHRRGPRGRRLHRHWIRLITDALSSPLHFLL
jgi:hypothetical protein